jgi:hypothetical protein
MTKEHAAYRVALGASFLGCLLATTAIANAQSVVSGVSVVAPPPAGFNALKAFPEARAKYAIPPAPDASVAPEAYRRWERALSSPQERTTPVLEHTDIYNGPAEIVGPAVAEENEENGIATATTSNWSGSAVVDSSKPFKTEAIIGEFVVPTAHQAFGSCTGSWDYSSQWPGIDGYGSSDVLQAGVEVDALCSGGTTSGFYSAWVEWFPFSETRVSSPAIHPGDLIFVEVWNTSQTNGYAYFYNYSTEQSAEYTLTAPKATSLVGNSAEWIVERPSVGGRLATLTNYIDVSWPYGVAWNYKATRQTYYYMGSNPPTGTLYEITMLDDGGKGISSGSAENSDFLYFQDYGSACGRSGAPPC